MLKLQPYSLQRTAFKTAALASLLVDQDFDVRCVADLVVRNNAGEGDAS